MDETILLSGGYSVIEEDHSYGDKSYLADTFFRNMIDQMRDIILVVDLLGNILNANQAAIGAYGYSKDELCRMSVYDLRSSETRIEIDEQLKIAQEKGTLFRTFHVRRSGEAFPVEVSSRRFEFAGLEAVVSIIRDITVTVATETALRDREKQLGRLNEELTANHEELLAFDEELRQQLDELLVREEAMRRQNVVLTALHDTSLRLMRNFELKDVLNHIVSDATQLLGTVHGFIRLVDEEKGVFFSQIGSGYYAQDVGREIKLTEGLSGQVYRTGEIAVIDDYSTWANRLPGQFFDQVRSVVHAPLKEEDKVIGTFGVAFITPGRKFADQDIAILSRYADLASIALSNARLVDSLVEAKKSLHTNNEELTAAHEELLASEEELRQQFDELLAKEEKINRQNTVLHSVHETALGLMHRLDLDDVLGSIITSAAQLLDMPDGFINLIDEKDAVFIRKVAVGRFVQDMARRTKVTEGLLGQVFATGQIAVVNDYSKWEYRFSDSFFYGLHCVVIVPLKVDDRILGAFALASSQAGRTLADHELFLLHRFADMAAIAMDNAILATSYKNELAERKLAEEAIKDSETKYRTIFETANDGIYIHDGITGRIIDINIKACQMYGYTRDELLSGNLSLMGTGESPYSESEAKQWIERAVSDSPQLFQWKNLHKDGHHVWVEVNLQKTVIGGDNFVLAIVRDISERKAQEQAIRRLAYYDLLTGLPNRTYLREYLEPEMEKACRGEATGTVLFVDLDDLKMINDTMGHSSGDCVIKKAGVYIVGEAGENAVVARIGGDEFIVVLPGITERKKIKSIVGKMLKCLGRDYEIGNIENYMSASIGIAIYPEDGAEVEDILKNADLALYAAKKSGKNTYHFYDVDLQKTAYVNMLLKQRLREAIKRNELSLRYQPLVHTHNSEISSFEVLLRWKSPEFGPVPPDRFIPLAEESDMIQVIGKWVISKACRFARKLTKKGKNNIRVSVNVSPRQLATADFVPFIRDAIHVAGIDPNQLEIEITENALIASMEDSIKKLRTLRMLGVHLSLDDFGSGYCSLTYLKNLPVETLKIDKTFIDEIASDDNQLRFVNSIINMAHVQQLCVVAEGVENENQLNKLKECQCDFIQGFLISRPVSELEAIKLLNIGME
jgi:diguanylate cyclase (GGDEF)-like protein/PAS domain S-box-containing protein